MRGPIRRMSPCSPCVRSKHLRVYVQNVSVCPGTTRTCWNTCARDAGIHGDVLNVHTEAFWMDTRRDTHRHIHRKHAHAGHTRTHAKKTRNTQDPNRIKTTIFRTKNRCFFLRQRKMSSAQSHFFQMTVVGRPSRARAAGPPWTHNVAWKCLGSLWRSHPQKNIYPESWTIQWADWISPASRIFRESRDNPAQKIHAERSSKPLCRVNLRKKIRAERSSNPWCRLTSALDFHVERIKCLCWLTSALDSPRFLRSMDIVPSLRVLPSCFRSRLRRVQFVRCFPLRCTLLVHQHVPMCPSVRRSLTGMGVCSPRHLGTQRVLQVPYQTRLRVASDLRLTEQASGGARQVWPLPPWGPGQEDWGANRLPRSPSATATADHIRVSQVRLDDSKLATREKTRWRPAAGGSPKEEVTGHQEGCWGLTCPSRRASQNCKSSPPRKG